jgi:hypothetical protein
MEERRGKHPLELVRDHAKLSVMQRGLLALYPKQHAKRSFGWTTVKSYRKSAT